MVPGIKSPEELILPAVASARWLADLHETKIHDAQIEILSGRIGVFDLAELLARAAAANPERSPELLDLLQRIRKQAATQASASSNVTTHAHTTDDKEGLNKCLTQITQSDFIDRRIYSAISNKTSDSSDCKISVAQNTGTGRVTLRYDFGDNQTIYAKLYSDGLGAHSYRVQKTLWDSGFNRRSRYQVPEPLAFLPEQNLVLTRAVTGATLGDALRGDISTDLIVGAREAARWLAAFHRSSIRIGEPEPDWDSLKLFRISVRMIKAAAARPEQRDALLDLLHSLRDHLKKLPDRRPVAQTHGRYHHDHVFINGGAIAVIDLDRSLPTDPAKDVAEFLRVLRMTAFKSSLDMRRADEATDAFLNDYLAQVPEAASGLPFYWASFILLSLFGLMKKAQSDDPRSAALIDFHLREMKRAKEFGS